MPLSVSAIKLRPNAESAANRMIIQTKPLFGVGSSDCARSVNRMSNNEATTKASTIFTAKRVRNSILKSFLNTAIDV